MSGIKNKQVFSNISIKCEGQGDKYVTSTSLFTGYN